MKKIFIIFILISSIALTGCANKGTSKHDILYGTWVAKIENQNEVAIEKEKYLGRKEDYYLECDGHGNFSLKTSTNTIVDGYYDIADPNIVTFNDNQGFLLGRCSFDGTSELDCSEKSTYAFKYIKKDNN